MAKHLVNTERFIKVLEDTAEFYDNAIELDNYHPDYRDVFLGEHLKELLVKVKEEFESAEKILGMCALDKDETL